MVCVAQEKTQMGFGAVQIRILLVFTHCRCCIYLQLNISLLILTRSGSKKPFAANHKEIFLRLLIYLVKNNRK